MLGDVSFAKCITLYPGTFMLGDLSFINLLPFGKTPLH